MTIGAQLGSGAARRGLAIASLMLAVVTPALVSTSVSAREAVAPSGSTGASGRSAVPRSITIEWVGDIAFGEAYGLPPGGLAAALAPIRPRLRSDLTMGNLETTLAVGGEPKCASIGSSNCFAYEAPPGYARQLRQSGFRLLNDANNHALDFGFAGRAATLAALRRAGLAYSGLPGQITRLVIRGLHVAVVAFAPYTWTNDLLEIPAAEQLVRRARRDANLVIVIIHAGAEGATEDHVPYGTEYDYGEDRGDSRAFAHAVIDAGASIVVGSGPHVIRGIQRYRDRMIAYSLGNFASWDNLGRGGTLSLSAILRVTLSGDGTVLAGRWIPLKLVGPGLPRYDPSSASTALVRQLSREDFGAGRYDIRPDGVIEPGPRQ